MNFAFVIGRINKQENDFLYLNDEAPFYADHKIEKDFTIPIYVNPLVFKKDYEVLKIGLLVSIKCRIEISNNQIKLVAERIKIY